MLVIDASVWARAFGATGDDSTRYRQRLHGEDLAAPDVMRLEVLSTLRKHLIRGEVTAKGAEEAFAFLLDEPVRVYPAYAVLDRCWQLRGNITPYDASYVALAEALGCPLVTTDAKLAKAPGPICAIEVL